MPRWFYHLCGRHSILPSMKEKSPRLDFRSAIPFGNSDFLLPRLNFWDFWKFGCPRLDFSFMWEKYNLIIRKFNLPGIQAELLCNFPYWPFSLSSVLTQQLLSCVLVCRKCTRKKETKLNFRQTFYWHQTHPMALSTFYSSTRSFFYTFYWTLGPLLHPPPVLPPYLFSPIFFIYITLF